MAKILVIAEHDGVTLNPSVAKTVACAAEIDAADIDVVVFAESAKSIAGEAAQLDSISRVLTVENPANKDALAAILAPQVASLTSAYSHVFGPSTTFGKDLMPRVAALIGVNQISDIMSVDGSHTFKRPIYAGNAIVTVEAPSDHPVVATVRIASYKAVSANNSASIENADVSVELTTSTRFVALEAGKSDRPDLQTAAKVVSGGRALGSLENFDLLAPAGFGAGSGIVHG